MGTPIDGLGGDAFVRALVHHFYAGVAGDRVLRPMYPDDLAAAEERLALFLIQFLGGDRGYERLRGEPRLRMRHLPFSIDRSARDAWVECMGRAVDATLADGFTPDKEDLAHLRDYFAKTATFLINKGLAIAGSS